MRLLVTTFIILLSLNTFAATKKKTAKPSTQNTKAQAAKAPAKLPQKPVPQATPQPQQHELAVDAPKASLFPVHSVLHHVPLARALVSAQVGGQFGTYSVETPSGGVTFTDDFDQQAITTDLEVKYGVLANLSIGANFGYSQLTIKNTEYRSTVPGVLPLAPNYKEKGVTDPSLLLDYRLLDSSFVLDLTGALRLGLISAVRGGTYDTNGDARGDVAEDGNMGSGSYATSAGLRAGLKLSNAINVLAGVSATYNFAGQYTKTTPNGDVVVNTDANVAFAPEVGAEYFVTKDFVLNPFARVHFNPKQQSHSLTAGIITAYEQAAGKVFNVGVNATYLAFEDFAIRGGYAYSSAESTGFSQGTNGTSLVSNTRNKEAHLLTLQFLYEF